jgi:cytochrome P450
MVVVISSSVEALVAILVVLFGSIVVKLFRDLIWIPYAHQKAYAGQGIRGRPYRILFGSVPEYTKLLRESHAQPIQNISHDIVPRMMPHFLKWRQIYGDTFLYWYGIQSMLYISEPELIKEVLSNKSGHYEKPIPPPLILFLLGRGLVLIDGLTWVKHRKIVSHVFEVDKLKTMVKKMAACTSSMLENWQELVAQADSHGKEIDVHVEFSTLTSEIISHAVFGSSYNEGKKVFELQRELQQMVAKVDLSIFIPGIQYIPTKKNRYAWKIDRRLKEILHSIIQARLETKTTTGTDVGYGNDLLGIMLAANQKELGGSQRNLSMNEIMDECKTFFFGGQESTANLLTWAVFLLAINPEWQEVLRKEVLSFCGTHIPDANMLSRMKSMTMVLNETLRLYPPATMIIRHACKEMKLGQFSLPKGASLTLPILAMQHDEKLWGPDAKLFNPERFAEGTSRAAIHPNAFIPFSLGPRNCVGQNFSMLEAKTVLAMILQRFSFSLSPLYKHSPNYIITLEPKNGMQIIFKNIIA